MREIPCTINIFKIAKTPLFPLSLLPSVNRSVRWLETASGINE